MRAPLARLFHLGIFNVSVVIFNQPEGMNHTSRLPQLHGSAVWQCYTRSTHGCLFSNISFRSSVTSREALSAPALLLGPPIPDGSSQHEAPQATTLL